jgi:menaquinone-dependent protoporphyrinogen oxidase
MHTEGFTTRKILILFSTVDNHTKKISTHLQSKIREEGHDAIVCALDEACNMEEYDTIIIGASIRYGKHNKKVYEFIEKYKEKLDNKPNAFFSVNIVARKSGKNRPDTNPYMIKFLKQINWKPKNLAVFAGKLDYSRYSFLDREMIRFIMWLTKGPTDPKSKIEFTNWNEVNIFASAVCKL